MRTSQAGFLKEKAIMEQKFEIYEAQIKELKERLH